MILVPSYSQVDRRSQGLGHTFAEKSIPSPFYGTPCTFLQLSVFFLFRGSMTSTHECHIFEDYSDVESEMTTKTIQTAKYQEWVSSAASCNL